jgi:hypothetical protein
MHPNQALANLVSPDDNIPHRFRAALQAIENADEFDLKKSVQILVSAIAHERCLIAYTLKIDFPPGTRHILKLLGVRHDGSKRLCHLVDIEETQNEMAKSSTKFHFGLDKRGAVSFQRSKEEFLHLIS